MTVLLFVPKPRQVTAQGQGTAGVCHCSGVSADASVSYTRHYASSNVHGVSRLSVTTVGRLSKGRSRRTAPWKTTCSRARRPGRRGRGTASCARCSTLPGPEAARDAGCPLLCTATSYTHNNMSTCIHYTDDAQSFVRHYRDVASRLCDIMQIMHSHLCDMIRMIHSHSCELHG